MPVFVKIDDSVPLDSVLLGKLVRASKEKRQVTFEYHADKGPHPVTLEPYRVVYFAGFWYLVGNETATGILKRYALDRISDLKMLKVRFKTIPANLDDMLKGSSSIWFSDSKRLAVKVLVDASVAHYFKRRRMHPSQEIKEERPDGSLLVTFRVGQYEEIRNILKSWIPYIVILAPQKFRMDLLDDVKGWVRRQEELGDRV
jgi:predicted DNA-binding transcriptional regulator YafY